MLHTVELVRDARVLGHAQVDGRHGGDERGAVPQYEATNRSQTNLGIQKTVPPAMMPLRK